jgi:hypothetical protein
LIVARVVPVPGCAAVLQASAADNGQCLVHDMTAFDSNGVVDGLVNNVAAANVSESEKSPDPVKALVWHGTSLLLVGTEQGEEAASQHAQNLPAAEQCRFEMLACWLHQELLTLGLSDATLLGSSRLY